jgi:hypothetical protein
MEEQKETKLVLRVKAAFHKRLENKQLENKFAPGRISNLNGSTHLPQISSQNE